MTLKEKLEAQWRAPGVAQRLARAAWSDAGRRGIMSNEGENLCAADRTEAYLNKLRTKDYAKWGRYGAPAPRKLTPPDWLRERYKKNCLRNHKTLIAEYGGVNKNDMACEEYVKAVLEARSPATETA